MGGSGHGVVKGDFPLQACWLYGVFYRGHGDGECVECFPVGWIDCARRTGMLSVTIRH